MKEKRQQGHGLPDGPRIDLIAPGKSFPEKVPPLRDPVHEALHCLDVMPPPHIAWGIGAEFPGPIEPADQPLDAGTEDGGIVDPGQNLAVVLENLAPRPRRLIVQTAALIGRVLSVEIMALVEAVLADQPAS